MADYPEWVKKAAAVCYANPGFRQNLEQFIWEEFKNQEPVATQMTTRRYLEDSEVNEIARRTPRDSSDTFDLIFTVRKMRRELEVAQGTRNPTELMMKTICLGIQDAIVVHGPITKEWVSSAAKRVYGRLRGIKL